MEQPKPETDFDIYPLYGEPLSVIVTLKVHYDNRMRTINTGDIVNRVLADYHELSKIYFKNYFDSFINNPVTNDVIPDESWQKQIKVTLSKNAMNMITRVRDYCSYNHVKLSNKEKIMQRLLSDHLSLTEEKGIDYINYHFIKYGLNKMTKVMNELSRVQYRRYADNITHRGAMPFNSEIHFYKTKSGMRLIAEHDVKRYYLFLEKLK